MVLISRLIPELVGLFLVEASYVVNPKRGKLNRQFALYLFYFSISAVWRVVESSLFTLQFFFF